MLHRRGDKIQSRIDGSRTKNIRLQPNLNGCYPTRYPSVGEVKTEGQLYQNQITKTLGKFLGVDYQNGKTTGEIIKSAFK